jgi:twitching motility protein PilT
MTLLDKLFRFVIQEGISDLFLVSREPPMFRRWNEVSWSSGEPILDPLTVSSVLRDIAPAKVWSRFEKIGEAEFALDLENLGRFRAHYFHDVNGLGAAFRVVSGDPPSLKDLGHSELIHDLCDMDKGLILVSGPPSSGKSTTAAAMVAHINETQTKLITTFEHQIEYRHENAQSFISQVTLQHSQADLEKQTRLALREGVDVIVFDELSRIEELEFALHVSELGPLVIGVIPGLDSVSIIEWLLMGANEDRRESMRRRLSTSLRAILNQRLLKTVDDQGLALAVEILLCSSQISSLIYEERLDQIPLTIGNASRLGMVDLNSALLQLVAEKHVQPLEAYREAIDKEVLIEGFRRAGIPFSPPRFSDMQISHTAHRNLIPVNLSRQKFGSFTLADGQAISDDDATTIVTRPKFTTDRLKRAMLDGDAVLSSSIKVIEPALLELGRIVNASARARLLLQHPNRSESIIELFGGSGILYGRHQLDRQRGIRNDWVCQAFPPDNPEAQQLTRRISRIHGGFRVPDNGAWQMASWGEAGTAINGIQVPPDSWLTLPKQPFQLEIAAETVKLDCQAFHAQALVLKRPKEEGVWYVVLRHRVDFGLTQAGFDVAAGLNRSQHGFGVVYTDGHFVLIPGMAGNVTSKGKPIDSHRKLEPGMEIEVGRYSLTFQPLMVKDPAR